MSDEWKKSEMSDVWDFEGEKELVGKLVDIETGVGANNSVLYTITTEKGDFSVWGSTVLDARMKRVQKGDDVKIIYLGKKASVSRKGKEYKDFEVYYKSSKSHPLEVGNEDIDPDTVNF